MKQDHLERGIVGIRNVGSNASGFILQKILNKSITFNGKPARLLATGVTTAHTFLQIDEAAGDLIRFSIKGFELIGMPEYIVHPILLSSAETAFSQTQPFVDPITHQPITFRDDIAFFLVLDENMENTANPFKPIPVASPELSDSLPVIGSGEEKKSISPMTPKRKSDKRRDAPIDLQKRSRSCKEEFEKGLTESIKEHEPDIRRKEKLPPFDSFLTPTSTSHSENLPNQPALMNLRGLQSTLSLSEVITQAPESDSSDEHAPCGYPGKGQRIELVVGGLSELKENGKDEISKMIQRVEGNLSISTGILLSKDANTPVQAVSPSSLPGMSGCPMLRYKKGSSTVEAIGILHGGPGVEGHFEVYHALWLLNRFSELEKMEQETLINDVTATKVDDIYKILVRAVTDQKTKGRGRSKTTRKHFLEMNLRNCIIFP
eukprot:TRINITY_DN6379_c0_g1_i1.p1 TRINITY_DN6379_c0_g1~~TRINITY_DN6379_c0_g1_i1.p1  ORF type:complete len:433 (-),score=36.00 TRINITY_DN6379_c0_g1_i1:584-1882(-)